MKQPKKDQEAFPPFAGKFNSCKNCYSSGDKLTGSFLPLSLNAIFTSNKTGLNEVSHCLPKRNNIKKTASKDLQK